MNRRASSAADLAILVTLGLTVAGAGMPWVVEATRDHRLEAWASGALETIRSAVARIRGGDLEHDHGTLEELRRATLIDGVIGRGRRVGYRFDLPVPAESRP